MAQKSKSFQIGISNTIKELKYYLCGHENNNMMDFCSLNVYLSSLYSFYFSKAFLSIFAFLWVSVIYNLKTPCNYLI